MEEAMKKAAIRALRDLARQIEGGAFTIDNLAESKGYIKNPSADFVTMGSTPYLQDGTYSLSLTVRKTG